MNKIVIENKSNIRIKADIIKIIIDLFLTNEIYFYDFFQDFYLISAKISIKNHENLSNQDVNNHVSLKFITLEDFNGTKGFNGLKGFPKTKMSNFCVSIMVDGDYLFEWIKLIFFWKKNVKNNIFLQPIISCKEHSDYLLYTENSIMLPNEIGIIKRFYKKTPKNNVFTIDVNSNLKLDKTKHIDLIAIDMFTLVYINNDIPKKIYNMYSVSIWRLFESHPIFGKHALLEIWCKNQHINYPGLGQLTLFPYFVKLLQMGIKNVYLEVYTPYKKEHIDEIMNMELVIDPLDKSKKITNFQATLHTYLKIGFKIITYVQTFHPTPVNIEANESWYFLMHLKLTPSFLITQVLSGDISLKLKN